MVLLLWVQRKVINYIAKDTNLLTQSLEEFTGEGYEVVTIADELANTMCLPTKLAIGESGEFIPANNDMMGQIAGFQNGNNLSGMSDASALFSFGSLRLLVPGLVVMPRLWGRYRCVRLRSWFSLC